MQKENLETSSFKDPDAQVIVKDNDIYREIMFSYKDNYDMLMNSGLYQELISKNLLIKHKEIQHNEKNVYKLIKPEKVFITYPWEWCFSQLKDAALTTLNIQLTALNYGMSLKDANCFNIQFYNNKPLLIDTSSFEKYNDGQPWCAYRQFCENFLAPLALMTYTDISLNKLLLLNINGINLDLASKLLGIHSIINFDLFFHIKLHAILQNQYSDKQKAKINANIPLNSTKNIIKNLINCISKMKLKKSQTEWGDYYNFTNYEKESFDHKKEIILSYKETIKPQKVWDFGANTGIFSRLFSDYAQEIFAFDIDPLAVEKNYIRTKENEEKNIYPVVFDMVNPSPSTGWNNEERRTLISRSNNPDVIMALALIHHLRFTYNIPFFKIRDYFSNIAPYLIIEFVQKDDSQIKKMLMNRKDIFTDYNCSYFEEVFMEKYKILNKTEIKNSKRIMYLMELKNEK